MCAEVRYVPQTDDWLATVVLPLQTSFGDGRDLVLGAHRPRPAAPARSTATRSPGPASLTIVDAAGHKVFDPQQTDLTDHAIVAEAVGLLASRTPIISVEPYQPGPTAR